MVSRKIVWSPQSKIRLYEILDFFKLRNKSNTYSQKLYKNFKEQLSIVNIHPEIGVKTNYEKIRGLIVGNYVLFYEIEERQINVLTVWDSRQNPEDLKII